MKVCHLFRYDPKFSGGIKTAVENIRRPGDRAFHTKTNGISLFLRTFIVAIRVPFSGCDVVHIHDESGYGYLLLPRFLRKPVVFSCHGLSHVYYQLIPPKGVLAKLKAKIHERMERRLIMKSDVLVSTANWMQEEIAAMFGRPSVVIHNGIDTGVFVPSRQKKEYDYIWVGTNSNLRGLEEAVKFASGNRLLVVGSTGASTMSVTFAGNVPHERMPEMYAKAKSLVYFSKSKGYTFGVLEAMSSGLGILSSRHCIEEIVGNADVRQVRGVCFISPEKSRQLAKKFDWKKIRKSYASVYESLGGAR